MKKLTGESGVWEKLYSTIPYKFGKYNLLDSVITGQSQTFKGVYCDSETGQKVFTKASSNKTAMVREFNKHLEFYTLTKQLITVPKPISVEKINNKYVLITEFLEDLHAIYDFDANLKIEAYLKVLTYLDDVRILDKPRVLATYSLLYQIISLPYFYMMNILHFPTQIRLITQSFAKVLKHLIQCLGLSHKTLTHGDLNVGNVLISKDKVVLLDFSKACISHRYVNLAQALNSAWRDEGFQEKLYEEICRDFNLSKKEQEKLSAFAIYNLMQRMCKKYKNKEQENYYFARMQALIKKL